MNQVGKTRQIIYSLLKKSFLGNLSNQVRVNSRSTNQIKAYSNFSTNENALNEDDDERVWRENWERRCDLATAYRGLAK